ncbi:tetratricopeptide repeat protein [Candidatus Magnetominusculus dajiuhuensis]|uniref:tetratricopeptide repeat protein n=1 Tax=Candidatus Magnetominusculus dajiuhuensis TaxID=3137712 RepID=UPI003B438E3F
MPDIATTCNNLARLLRDMDDLYRAKVLFEDALRIRRKFAEKHPAAYLKRLAEIRYNYTVLLKKMGDRDEAKKYFKEHNNIRKKLKEASK